MQVSVVIRPLYTHPYYIGAAYAYSGVPTVDWHDVRNRLSGYERRATVDTGVTPLGHLLPFFQQTAKPCYFTMSWPANSLAPAWPMSVQTHIDTTGASES